MTGEQPAGWPAEESQAEGPRITDRRKIDPTTYEVRSAAPSAPAGGSAADAGGGGVVPGPIGEQGSGAAEPAESQAGPGLAELKAQAAASAEQAAEAVADLQRITAEYANYRKRVDRDRDLHRDLAIGSVLAELLPILDDIERARAHGDLDGPFKLVAEALEAAVRRLGLEAYGQPTESFDPTVHEAMTSHTDPAVSEPTVTAVYQVGYRLRGRVLRPARVAVTDGE